MYKLRVYKEWSLHFHRMPMFRWQIGINLELTPGDNYCLSVCLAWLGDYYLQLNNAASLYGDTYQ